MLCPIKDNFAEHEDIVKLIDALRDDKVEVTPDFNARIADVLEAGYGIKRRQ
jgi:hypothetical protein